MSLSAEVKLKIGLLAKEKFGYQYDRLRAELSHREELPQVIVVYWLLNSDIDLDAIIRPRPSFNDYFGEERDGQGFGKTLEKCEYYTTWYL